MSPAQEVEARARAPRGQGGELRDELLDAAERLLIEKGTMTEVSIRRIVDAVGVTPPSLYLHFEDKDDLFFEVCYRRFEDFLEVMESAIEGIDDPVERGTALGRAYVRYGVQRSEHYQILFGAEHESLVAGRDVSDGPGMKAFGLLYETVEECIRSGRFRDVDPLMTTLSLWAGVHGVVMLTLSQDAEPHPIEMPDPEALGDMVCTTMIRGLLAD